MIVLFLGSFFAAGTMAAASGASSSVLGVQVTPVKSDPGDLDPPPMTGLDDSYLSGQEAQENAAAFNQMEDAVTGDINVQYTVSRTFGSGWVKLTYMNKYAFESSPFKDRLSETTAVPFNGVWMFETSYGCSLLQGATGSVILMGRAYEFVYYPCTTANILPAAPNGFASWQWWKLVEQDAYGEIWYQRYSVANPEGKQGVKCDRCPSAPEILYLKGINKPTNVWYAPYLYDRDSYLAWLRDEYQTALGTDYRGQVYSEQTVGASCGGAWLPWAAPWGCATLVVPYKTVIETYGGGGTGAAWTPRWSVNTDPVGVASERWPVRAKMPPENGEPDWCYAYTGITGGLDPRTNEGQNKLWDYFGSKNFQPWDPFLSTCGQLHPLMNDINYACKSAMQQYWGADGYDFPSGCPEGLLEVTSSSDYVVEGTRDFSVQTGDVSGTLGLMVVLFPECGSFGATHDSLKPQCSSEGFDDVVSYMDSLPLIDKLIFIKYIEEHQMYRYTTDGDRRCWYSSETCPLPSMSDLMANFDEYRSSGDRADLSYGTQEEHKVYTNEANPYESWEGSVCPILTSKTAAAKLLAGQIDRNAPLNECNILNRKLGWDQTLPDLTKGIYGSCEQIKDSSGKLVAVDCTWQKEKALLPSFVLTGLFLTGIANIVIVDISNYWIAVWILAAILIVIGYRRRSRTRTQRRL